MQEQEALFKIIYQVATLCVLGLTGFLAGRTRYLPETSGFVLSRIVIKLTTPILLLTTMANYNFTPKTIRDGISIYICGLIFVLFSFIISSAGAKIMKLENSTASVYKMLSMFGNVIYLAYPLLGFLYKQDGIIYAIFFNLANDSLLWTLGIYMVNSHNSTKIKDSLKNFINGNTIAFAIGVLFIAFNLKGRIEHSNIYIKGIYSFLLATFQPLGNTTIYFSMIFIGLILSQVKFNSMKDVLKRYPLIVMSMFKLLVVPITALLILKAAGSLVDPFAKSIIVLQLAMPSGTIVSALASQYESDYGFATEGIFFSTIIGVVTLPFMVHLLSVFRLK